MSLTLNDAQQQCDQWIQQLGQGYYGILTNTGILAEECGEVCRLLVRIHGEQSFKDADPLKDQPEAQKEALADEMADLLWVLCALANQNGIDLSSAFIQNMQKKSKRDADRHLQNSLKK